MFIPTITVKQDIETDIGEFTKFIYRWSQEKRESVIRAYPGLNNAALQGEESGKQPVDLFVREQYRIYHDQIEILVADMKMTIQKDGAKVLEALGVVMEYSWPRNDINYTIIPTLLPFSPLQPDVFFFSLERFLRTNTHSVASNYGMIAVLAHEVSHFIFLDILNDMPNDMKNKCDKTITYFAKEILAPVVMNEPRMNIILQLTGYGGNPLLKHIIIKHGEKEENIVTFFRAEFARQRADGTTFKEFVSYLIETLINNQQEIQTRQNMWDKYGGGILSDLELKGLYCRPIEI